MDDRSFLGTGMKFPPQINKATGRFVTSSFEESVKESIYLILMTGKNERVFLPSFGSRLMSYTFMDTSATQLNIMSRDLKDTILSQEPRVSDVNITIEDETVNGRLIVNIDYVISGTNTRDNLVFPFYLNAATEDDTNG